MTFSGFDAQLLGQLQERSASPAQIYLLQRVIRAVEPQTLLSQHAGALAGIATEVPRAQAALLSHGETGQPWRTLLIALLGNASTAVKRVRRAGVSDYILTDLFNALNAGIATLPPSKPPTPLQTAARTLAQQLDPLIQQIPDQLSQNFQEAWIIGEPTVQEWKILDCVSTEAACLVASSDRDSASLEWQIPQTVRHEGLDPERIYQVLLPHPRKYHVACVIRGAGKLAQLSTLEPTAQQEQPSDSTYQINWPVANRRLREFISKVTPSTHDCVISVDVYAVDRASAARLGRRRVTELLDQYVAGMRVIQLTIDRMTLVARAGTEDTQEWEPPHRGTGQAYPLTDYWPEGLREGLRTAHIARITDAPLTTAALSWVALEACELEYSKKQELARVLSLQALRQQVVEAHQMIPQSIASALQYWDNELNKSADLLRKHQVGLMRLPPGYDQRRQELESLIKSAEERHSSVEQRLAKLRTVVDTAIPSLNKYAAVDTRSNHLMDLNAWVDILLPARALDSAELTSARAALTMLLPELFPLVVQQIVDWQARLGNADTCANWLTTTESRIVALLDALYSARNLALHSGVFTASGDAALGQGAVLVVDFTFEFLGNWYRSASKPCPPKRPVEVVRDLAARQQTILARLAAHKGPIYPLDVGFLTGPGAMDAWSRE